MAGWESLRMDLRRLREESPRALVVWPDPDSEQRNQPIRIDLAAWATDIAAVLHAKYGDVVELHVGAMTFPARQLWVGDYSLLFEGEPAESVGLDVELLSPLTVRTGRFTRHDVLVTNRGTSRQVLATGGDLLAAVTDSSGRAVGLYVGPLNARRVEFWIEPHQSSVIPVLISTASVVPELGYAVPPGQWQLVIAPHTSNGLMLSAPLELTITP